MDTLPTEGLLKFDRPKWDDILLLVIVCDAICAMVVWIASDLAESTDGLPGFTVLLFFFTLLFAVVSTIERVRIDGPIVRVMNHASWFGWRTFSVEEVARITYIPNAYRSSSEQLVVHLNPGQYRSWDRIRFYALTNAESGKGTPFLGAFLRAVSQAQPGMNVQKLPSHYRQMLPDGLDAAWHGGASASPGPAQASTKRRTATKTHRKKQRSKAKA